ncbi:MAG: threonine--tRNA ligase [Firmicutes bacterium]|nr:threonine--tRNA ligase [Bacillota bacterium]MDD4694739.1 threonine--tRNA ligase [Bacillota bacterium]
MLILTLPDGSKKEYHEDSRTTGYMVAEEISPRLAKAAIAIKLDDQYMDLNRPLPHSGSFEVITLKSEAALEIVRHSASHIMAQAVKRLFPSAKFAIGPATKDGFYYDIDLDEKLSEDDLEKIETEMKKIVSEDVPFARRVLSRNEALAYFAAKGDQYKVEIIEELEGDVSLYAQGEFEDLCRGPHLPSTGKLKAFKLLSLAGAYWRGDSKRPMLQRIYGTAFTDKDSLKKYLTLLEEAAKRDHRKLGKELDLFSVRDEGPGFPFFHPKGMVLRNNLEDFWRKIHRKAGYEEIKTPIILNEQLWRNSGHWDKYKENMYFTTIDDTNYAIKPMNCPGGMLLYDRQLVSYRDLPMRYGELGLVHRHELSGTLHGLMRVRCFTQDDAHIFMRPDQIEDEIIAVIDLIDYVYSDVFGFEYHVELSTRPENSFGSVEIWDLATNALKKALVRKNLEFTINEGDGAFYGPKIDFHLTDCLGRTWQCGTIQLDYLMPERFKLSYIGEDGQKHQPIIVHRVVFGSIERFIAILTEHFAGAFPTWLAPVQVQIIPVSDAHREAALRFKTELDDLDVRAHVDDRDEKLGYKIRAAQLEKIPYMIILGDKEIENETISLRSRILGDLGSMDKAEFVKGILEEITSLSVDSSFKKV